MLTDIFFLYSHFGNFLETKQQINKKNLNLFARVDSTFSLLSLSSYLAAIKSYYIVPQILLCYLRILFYSPQILFCSPLILLYCPQILLYYPQTLIYYPSNLVCPSHKFRLNCLLNSDSPDRAGLFFPDFTSIAMSFSPFCRTKSTSLLPERQ